MDRRCEFCGKPISGRATKRYCNSSCRAKASERRKAGKAPSPAALESGLITGAIESAVTTSTPLGALALELARRLDLTASDTAAAGLARELRATLTQVGAASMADEVDELTERRQRRHAG